MNGELHFPQFPDTRPEISEELDLEERVLPNGRRIVAVHEHVIQLIDSNGLKSYRSEKRAALDCACDCRLRDGYFCFNPECQKVVCYRHAAGPCSLCQGPSFCNACIVAVALEQGSANVQLLCKACFQEVTAGIVVRVIRWVWRWVRG